LLVAAAVAVTLSANAASVDFSDPRRALGREDDVKVDAQLASDTISPSSLVSITYQIENLGPVPVAIANKIASAEFDAEAGAVNVSIGAEIPTGAQMPHLTVIKPGEKRTFTIGALAHVPVPSIRNPWTATPRSVQIRVTLLRDLAPFAQLIEQQTASQRAPRFPEAMFTQWVEGSNTVYLNAIPVRWKPDGRSGPSAADRSATSIGGTI
jgi:hypothetical protein